MASTAALNKQKSKTSLHSIEGTKVPSVEIKLKNFYWNSTLFDDVYVDRKMATAAVVDGDENFEKCHADLLDLFSKRKATQIEGWTETETINHWIKPVLRALGWSQGDEDDVEPFAEETSFSFEEDGKIKTYRADILIADKPEELENFADRRLESDVKLKEAKKHVLIPIEAKYWDRLKKQKASKLTSKEEREKAKALDDTRALSPNRQTLKYMEILNLEWGILTDGATWRLFNKSISGEDDSRCLEFNVYALYKVGQRALSNEKDGLVFREAARFFYQFFGKRTLITKRKTESFIYNALAHSERVAKEVKEELKYRFLDAMNIVCNGFYRASKKDGAQFELIRSAAESHLFNILFIKSCESKGILNTKIEDYWDKSISKIIDRLHVYNPDKSKKSPGYIKRALTEAYYWFNYQDDGTDLYEHLINLTKMIHSGTNGKSTGFFIEGFKESVFSNEEWTFVNKYKLTNIEMVRALFELGFTKAPKGLGIDYQEIPYSFFTPRQLGSIYESFLEFKLQQAPEDMAFVKQQWKPANLGSDKVQKLKVPKVKKGELFFTPDNKDRKATGSYYTPDYVVKFIVKETLDPLCKKKTAKEILDVKICDPAMGSGHFLNGALQYLADAYMAALDDEILDDIHLAPEVAKRIVLDKCIFGVDINRSAVKLAKLSLWLESAVRGQKLEKLQDQLVESDFLKTSPKELWLDKKNLHIDAFLSNPPWIDIKELPDDYVQFLFNRFESTKNRANIFAAFLENMISYEGSSIGTILPSSVLTQSSYEDLRKIVLKARPPSAVVKMPDNVFEGVTAEVAVLVLGVPKKAPARVMVYNSTEKLSEIRWESGAKVSEVSVEEWRQSGLINVHFNSNVSGLLTKLETNSVDLSTVCEFCLGLTPYDKARGHTPKQIKDRVFHATEKLSKEFKPLVSGKNISRYIISDEYEEYIKYGPWLGAPRNPKFFNQPHLIIRQIVGGNPQRLFCGYTDKEVYNTQVGFNLIPQNGVDLFFVLGLLNSKLISFYHANKFLDLNKKTFQKVLIQDAKRIPIKMDNTKLVKAIASTAGQLWSNLLNNSGQTKQLDEKIDSLVYELYGLTKQEISSIESYFCSSSVSREVSAA